jgi:hypothetical protein
MIVLPGGTELGTFEYRGHPTTVAVSTTVTLSITTTYGDGSPLPLAVVRVDPHDCSLTWHWSPVTDQCSSYWPDLKDRVMSCTEAMWRHLAWGATVTPELSVNVTYRRPRPDPIPADFAQPLDLIGTAA